MQISSQKMTQALSYGGCAVSDRARVAHLKKSPLLSARVSLYSLYINQIQLQEVQKMRLFRKTKFDVLNNNYLSTMIVSLLKISVAQMIPVKKLDCCND